MNHPPAMPRAGPWLAAGFLVDRRRAVAIIGFIRIARLDRVWGTAMSLAPKVLVALLRCRASALRKGGKGR